MPVVITADITADISQELQKEFDIHVLPLHVQIDETRGGLEGVDVTSEDVYRAYRDEGLYPKTAARSPGEYEAFFRQFTRQGCEVVHVALCSKYSSSYQAALIAAEAIGGVFVVDSRLMTTASGMLCVQAAKLRDAGQQAEAIARQLETMRYRVKNYIYLDKLDVVAKSGRAPVLLAMGANLLNIHPCLIADAESGSVRLGKKYRGKSAAAQRQWLENGLSAFLGAVDLSLIFLVRSYGVSDELYEEYRQTALALPGLGRLETGMVGCTMLAHCGFNCMALVGLER
ncbi:MAG: DegV family protein [Oscillospiraceae bacterium]|jgi:DegV family protein with EDD domain|nr:DegV family protein [Oscillospiraceae bacterium]